MVDYLTDIPLPGRTFAAPIVGATARRREAALPAFVVGPENRLVAATINRLLDAAGAPCDSHPNGGPRFAPGVIALFGRSGTGKTHLAQGLVRHWQQHRGVDTAHYVTASDFRRQFAAGLRSEAVVEFRRHFRGRQLLAIDDLHHLPADDAVLQEMRYTLDDYDESGGTVLVTSSRPASILKSLSVDLRSRLGAGLMLQLASPGPAARLRIVRRISTTLNEPLSEEVAQRLAAGITGTAPDLIGALFEACSATCVNGKTAARDAGQLPMAEPPTLHEIIALVARYTGVPQKQLKSGSRRQAVVFARAVAAYLARELAAASYHEIGRALGGRDHTTILHNYRKIEHDRLHCPATQETLDELRRLLLSR